MWAGFKTGAAVCFCVYVRECQSNCAHAVAVYHTSPVNRCKQVFANCSLACVFTRVSCLNKWLLVREGVRNSTLINVRVLTRASVCLQSDSPCVCRVFVQARALHFRRLLLCSAIMYLLQQLDTFVESVRSIPSEINLSSKYTWVCFSSPPPCLYSNLKSFEKRNTTVAEASFGARTAAPWQSCLFDPDLLSVWLLSLCKTTNRQNSYVGSICLL